MAANFTIAEFQKAFPDMHKEIYQQGYAAGFSEQARIQLDIRVRERLEERKVPGPTVQALPQKPLAVVAEKPIPQAAKPLGCANLPVKERAKIDWARDSALRAGFGDDYDAYEYYLIALENGQVRIFGQEKKRPGAGYRG